MAHKDTHFAKNGTIPIVYMIDFLSYGSGMENQLAWLLKNLDRQQFSPMIVILRSAESSDAKDIDCPMIFLDVRSLVSWKTISAIVWLIRCFLRNRVQILQIFSIDSNIVGVIAGWLAGVRHIVVCRRDMGLWYNSGPLRLLNLIDRLAHHCLANSAAVKTSVATREVFRPEQIHVVRNGIPIPDPADGPPLTKAELGIEEDAPVVGIVANFRPVKRIDRMIRILSEMENRRAHLVLVGMGVEKKALQNLVLSLGLIDRVHFYYTVKHTMQVIRLFTVGTLVSDSEGLSNVLIEYALSGIPTVAFDVGGNGEVVVESETGYLVTPYDEAAMAKTIDALLAEPEKAAHMGRVAAERARKEFALEKMVTGTQNFYEKIVADSDRQRNRGNSITALTRQVLYFLADIFGLNLLFRYLTCSQVRVLMYHSVDSEPLPSFYWTHLDGAMFQRQMEYVSNIFTVKSLTSLVTDHGGEEKDRPTVAITFDDGLDNTFSIAWPILRELRLCATCFVVPSLSESGQRIWADELYPWLMSNPGIEIDLTSQGMGKISAMDSPETRAVVAAELIEKLKSMPPDQRQSVMKTVLAAGSEEYGESPTTMQLMSREQIIELAQSAEFEIGGHSDTHPILSTLTPEQQDREIEQCQSRLKGWGLDPSPVFAYPNGRDEDFDQHSIAALERHGCTAAVTTTDDLWNRYDDPFRIPRIAIGGDVSFHEFKARMSGLHYWLKRAGRHRGEKQCERTDDAEN